MEQYKRDFIEFMLSADVLRFGSFVTKSGRNTPYFINTGNYRTGAQIATLGSFYALLIKETIQDKFTAIFGPAYKGIPIAVSTASALYAQYNINRPYFFNRKEEKDHGEGGSLIGYKPEDGDEIIITEDVITAGTAVREVMPILQGAANITAPHMFISVDRCEIGQQTGLTAVMQVKKEFNLHVHALVTALDIYTYLTEKKECLDLARQMEAYMQTYCALD